MRQLFFGFGLTGCIPFGQHLRSTEDSGQGFVDSQDTSGDTGLIDTNDTVDTDTQDTNDTVDTEDTSDTVDTGVENPTLSNDGLLAMRDVHLVMDSTILLELPTIPGGSNMDAFLVGSENWGFSVNIGPYNDETHAAMFGGGEFPLFSGNGGYTTLQWIAVDELNVKPVLTTYFITSNLSTPSVCHKAIYSGSQAFKVTSLAEGYQVLALHSAQEVVNNPIMNNSSIQLYIRLPMETTSTLAFESMQTVSSSCFSQTTTVLQFGAGRYVQGTSTDNTLNVVGYRGRLDDILIFDADGTNGLLESFQPTTSFGNVDTLTKVNGLFLNYDGSVDLVIPTDSNDGYTWFPIDESQAKINSGEGAQILWDESVENNNTTYRMQLIAVGSGQGLLSNADAQGYYYIENTPISENIQ